MNKDKSKKEWLELNWKHVSVIITFLFCLTYLLRPVFYKEKMTITHLDEHDVRDTRTFLKFARADQERHAIMFNLSSYKKIKNLNAKFIKAIGGRQ